MSPVITFLSDYGYDDEFAGVCRGVIARRCPQAHVIDLTHGIARHDVRSGALALRAALPYTPPGVHLAVVDPGVGGPRRAIALATQSGDRLLVGPDNGLLAPAAEIFGGVREAVDIGSSPERLIPVSATFHGRDIFAPVAAALAAGAALRELGETIETASLTVLTLSHAHIDSGTLVAHVLAIDGYGNVSLDATAALAERAGLHTAATITIETATSAATAQRHATFTQAAAGDLLAFTDARGALALAVNHGSAAQRLALVPGDELRLRAR